MGLNYTLIQPFCYLSITETFFIMEMFNQNINDLLSFGVFFFVNKFVGLELNRRFKEWSGDGKQGSIQNHSTTVEWVCMDHTFGRIGFGRIMETCLRSVGRLDGGGFKLLCFARIKIMQGIFMHWKIFMRIVRSDNLRFSLFGSRFPNCERDIFFPFKLEVLSVFYQLCGSRSA